METATESQRLFIAIRVPDAVKVELERVQTGIKAVLPERSTAWTKPDNMHLTMRFLGKVAREHLPQLVKRLSIALRGFGALELVCERLGCFPDLRFPRVVWAWVHDDGERLQRLHELVDGAVEGFAETPAKARFTGHITVARPKSIKRLDAERLAKFVQDAVERRFGHWQCAGLELIRSELAPVGSRYTTLAKISLTGRQPTAKGDE